MPIIYPQQSFRSLQSTWTALSRRKGLSTRIPLVLSFRLHEEGVLARNQVERGLGLRIESAV